MRMVFAGSCFVEGIEKKTAGRGRATASRPGTILSLSIFGSPLRLARARSHGVFEEEYPKKRVQASVICSW